MLPCWGAFLDATPKRKFWWKVMTILSVLSNLLLATLWNNYVWTISIVGSILIVLFYEFMWPTIGAYLPECAETEAEKRRISGFSSGSNLGAQVIAALIFTVLGFVIPGDKDAPTSSNLSPVIRQEVIVSICASVITSLWVAFLMPLAIRKMGARDASRELPQKGSNLPARACNNLIFAWKGAARSTKIFLLYHMFSAQGLNAVIDVCGTYFTEQTKISGWLVGIILAVVLVVAAASSFLYLPIARRVRPKTFLMCMHIYSLIITVGTPLLVNREGQTIPALLLGCTFGIAMGFYFAAEIAAYSMFVPKGQEATFMSLYNFSGYILRFAPTLIYTAFAQAQGTHTYAFATIGIWFVLAIIILGAFVSFDKATAVVGRRPSVYHGDCHRPSISGSVRSQGSVKTEEQAGGEGREVSAEVRGSPGAKEAGV